MSRPLRFPGGTQQVMIRLPREQYAQLQAKSERDGLPIAEQIRRALAAYLKREPKARSARRPRSTAHAPAHRVSLAPRDAVEVEADERD